MNQSGVFIQTTYSPWYRSKILLPLIVISLIVAAAVLFFLRQQQGSPSFRSEKYHSDFLGQDITVKNIPYWFNFPISLDMSDNLANGVVVDKKDTNHFVLEIVNGYIPFTVDNETSYFLIPLPPTVNSSEKKPPASLAPTLLTGISSDQIKKFELMTIYFNPGISSTYSGDPSAIEFKEYARASEIYLYEKP
jgi:hypothetical protein